jgi:anti-sigma regulatory factor (Ser/Thr protein kinase)
VEARQPISPGDALLVYSDGITEARNIADAEFGEERLRGFLLSLLRAHAVPARIALQALRKRVHDYAGERALADDETAVMVGLFGRPDTVETAVSPAGDGETFDLPWDFAGFEPLRRRVAAAAARLGPDAADRLVLASFEAATNVVRHVARPFPDATLCCRLRPGRDELTVELWYVGLPFEPEPERLPDLSGESEGGFGLHIIDHAVSRVSYEQPVLDVCCTRLVQSVAEQAAA